MTVYRLRSDRRLARLGEAVGVLLGEGAPLPLSGALYLSVLEALRTPRRVEELMAHLAQEVPGAYVVYAVQALERLGYIERACDLPASEAAWWSGRGVAPDALSRGRARQTVRVVGDGGGGLADALRREGFREGDALRVVLTDDYTDPALAALAARYRAEGCSWLPFQPTGEARLGPLFAPGGPCFTCLRQRLRHHQPLRRWLERRGDVPRPPRAETPASRQLAESWAVLQLSRWVAGDPQLTGHLLALAPGGPEAHPVTRRPQCPDCGDPGLVAATLRRPVRLTPRPGRSQRAGYRVDPPDVTFERLARHISPLTGAVAALSRDIDAAGFRVSYTATVPACPSTDTPTERDLTIRCHGKGSDIAQARTSALCEALERYCAVYQGDEERLSSTLGELGDEAVHPDALQGFSAAQHRRHLEDPLIARAFEEHAVINWAPAWSLTHGRRRYAPLDYCYVHTPTPRGERFCVFNTNGHAAGGCLEEAILQGLLELIERDAVSLWWYNRARRPGLSPLALSDPWASEQHRRQAAAGWQVTLLELTTDLGVPVYAAVGHRRDGAVCLGFGCHLSPHLAALRALTELNQLQLVYGAIAPPEGADTRWLHAVAEARLEPTEVDEVDLAQAVRACVTRLADRGLEVLVQDQTRPDVDLSVVKVMAPGLCHLQPRLAPGRLYQLPVRMGWLSAPHTEAALSPLWLHDPALRRPL